jgi:hypothetical protein
VVVAWLLCFASLTSKGRGFEPAGSQARGALSSDLILLGALRLDRATFHVALRDSSPRPPQRRMPPSRLRSSPGRAVSRQTAGTRSRVPAPMRHPIR